MVAKPCSQNTTKNGCSDEQGNQQTYWNDKSFLAIPRTSLKYNEQYGQKKMQLDLLNQWIKMCT